MRCASLVTPELGSVNLDHTRTGRIVKYSRKPLEYWNGGGPKETTPYKEFIGKEGAVSTLPKKAKGVPGRAGLFVLLVYL